MQASEGRYYLHEHPRGAASWKQECIVQLAASDPNAQLVSTDMCQFGLMVKDRSGRVIGRAMKPTRWLTNSPAIAKELDRKCCGGHEHVHMLNGLAKQGQIYPVQLCQAIVRGLSKQIQHDQQVARETLNVEQVKSLPA